MHSDGSTLLEDVQKLMESSADEDSPAIEDVPLPPK
jgi:hypothetical protein